MPYEWRTVNWMPKFEKRGCLMASRLLGLLFIRHSVWRLQDVAESTSYEIVAYYYLREKAVKSSMCSLLYSEEAE